MAEQADGGLQETLVQFEAGKKQLESLLQQGRVIEGALAEINAAMETLEELKKTEPGAELLVPIGGECLIRASLKDNQSVIVGVGAKVSVDRSVDEAVKTLGERAAGFERALAKARESAMALSSQLEELNARAEALIGRAQAQQQHK